jgi:hypothetical protein
MSTLVSNSFASYDLTEEEELQGSIFTTLQKQVLQNLMSHCAEEKLRLEYDVNNSLSFVQQEAYKRGQLDIIEYLLTKSEDAEAESRERNMANSNYSEE